MIAIVTVKIKDKNKNLSEKTNVYEEFNCSYDDPRIDRLIAKARKNFGESDLPVSVTVNIKMIED